MNDLQKILAFVLGLAPELYALFQKTKGDVEAGRSKLRSLIGDIKADEAAIDAELKRQEEQGT